MTWRRLLGCVSVSLLTLTACGASEEPADVPIQPAPPSGSPTDPQTPGADGGTADAGAPTPDAGLPPDTDAGLPPGTDAGTPNLDAGTPGTDGGFAGSLPPEDCVVWTGTWPPQEATACEVRTTSSQGSRLQRYDAEGRPVEDRLLNAQGVPTRVETWRWAQGLQVFGRLDELSWGRWSQTESTYDGQRRLLSRTITSSSDPEGTLSRYVYADTRLIRVDQERSGQVLTSLRYFYVGERLARIDLEDTAGTVWRSTFYAYDDAGRLLREYDRVDQDSYTPRSESFTYHANGHMQRASRYHEDSGRTVDEFDAQGRRIRTDWNNHQSGDERSTYASWSYDTAGRLLQTRSGANSLAGRESDTLTHVYDGEGRLGVMWNLSEQSSRAGSVTRLSTWRTTYLCGTSLAHHEDTDAEGDGLVDARCTYSRDARGARLRTECFSLPANPQRATSVDYTYDCH